MFKPNVINGQILFNARELFKAIPDSNFSRWASGAGASSELIEGKLVKFLAPREFCRAVFQSKSDTALPIQEWLAGRVMASWVIEAPQTPSPTAQEAQAQEPKPPRWLIDHHGDRYLEGTEPLNGRVKPLPNLREWHPATIACLTKARSVCPAGRPWDELRFVEESLCRGLTRQNPDWRSWEVWQVEQLHCLPESVKPLIVQEMVEVDKLLPYPILSPEKEKENEARIVKEAYYADLNRKAREQKPVTPPVM
jgi:hypothetical protein